jgi:hypothetical protein
MATRTGLLSHSTFPVRVAAIVVVVVVVVVCHRRWCIAWLTRGEDLGLHEPPAPPEAAECVAAVIADGNRFAAVPRFIATFTSLVEVRK